MTTPKRDIVYTDNFEREIKRLKKKFPSIKKLVAELASELESFEIIGDRIPNVEYEVYKARLPNPDAQKGKSGGFRVVYYLKTQEKIILITIYSKSDQADIPIEIIIQLIEEFSDSSE